MFRIGNSHISMFAGIKKTEARRKKKENFSRDHLGFGNKGSIEDFDFPKATPEQLAAIKEQMKRENRIQTVKTLCILLISLGIVIGGIWYLV